MSDKKIWICDDNEALQLQWEFDLSRLGLTNVEHVSQDALGEAVRQLEDRRVAAAKGPGHECKPDGQADLDNVDVLIVDYDLLELDKRAYLTGENVAYLARTFSQCGFILAMNQFGINSFDLTMKGHIESFADLNIGSKQLSNPNLWGQSIEGFNPWHWPVIDDWLTAQQQRVEQISGNLDSPLFEFFGFDNELVEIMPLSILGKIAHQENVTETFAITFREVIRNSPLGVREKNKSAISDVQLERIAAARISKWLDRMVLPCMEYLIDAPHLALRFPSLCGGVENISGMRGIDLKANPVDVLDSKIDHFAFGRPDWISKRVWWMHQLKGYGELSEVSNPWDAEFPDEVFCENVSTFCIRDDSRGFVAELPTASPQRWVTRDESVDYTPSVRFSI